MINICKSYILFSYDAPLLSIRFVYSVHKSHKEEYMLSYFNNHITF